MERHEEIEKRLCEVWAELEALAVEWRGIVREMPAAKNGSLAAMTKKWLDYEGHLRVGVLFCGELERLRALAIIPVLAAEIEAANMDASKAAATLAEFEGKIGGLEKRRLHDIVPTVAQGGEAGAAGNVKLKALLADERDLVEAKRPYQAALAGALMRAGAASGQLKALGYGLDLSGRPWKGAVLREMTWQEVVKGADKVAAACGAALVKELREKLMDGG